MSLKKSMVNFLGPLLPLSALNPSYGTLEVPVANWNVGKYKGPQKNATTLKTGIT